MKIPLSSDFSGAGGQGADSASRLPTAAVQRKNPSGLHGP